jgi:hypothetical protein
MVNSQDFVDQFAAKFGSKTNSANGPGAAADTAETPEDLRQEFAEHGIEVKNGRPYNDGKDYKFDLVPCPYNPAHNRGEAVLIRYTDSGIDYFSCRHENCKRGKWRDICPWKQESQNTEPSPKYAKSSVFDGPAPARFNWPEPLAEEAFYGLPGEVVRMIAPHTEADPAALLTQFLAGFGSLVGRHAYFRTDGSRQYPNLYVVIVGRTAKARKGTAWNQIIIILGHVDAEWVAERVMSGTSTGEGIIWALRDAIKVRHPIRQKGRVTGYEDVDSDPGVEDKRCLVVEEEFARTLKAAERSGNTLSEVLRDAFDKGHLRILTKQQAARSTGCHISFIAHVTGDELRRLLTDTSAANGYANRHLFVCAVRSKLLPEGGNIDQVDFTNVIERLQKAAEFARTCGEMKRDDEAKAIWREVYPDLSESKPGLFGSMTARFDAIAVRLSLIYALLDRSPLIRAVHLKAALAIVKYCEDSTRFIFGDSLGDETADEILRQLRSRPDGMTRTELRDFFQRNKTSAEISRALGVLQEHGLARVERRQESKDGFNLTERWFAVTVSEAK